MRRSRRITHGQRAVVLGSSRFPFANPFVFAPMEGVSHPEMRAIVAEHGGVGMVSTEFVRVGKDPLSHKSVDKHVVKFPGVPLSVQVMGSDEEMLALAARDVADAGADVVDLNLGCPMPRIVRKGVGAALLKDPPRLRALLAAMRKTVPGLLSAKIRAGFDDAGNVLTIARAVQDAGADFLTIHPRKRSDMLEGVADWRIIRVVKQELSIPVVGNGDVWYAADALRMREETGCDGVMIGRPALRNPWIFAQAADLAAGRRPIQPSGKDLYVLLESIVQRFRRVFAEKDPIGRVKELVGYMGRAVPDGRAYQRAALRQQTIDGILELSARALIPLDPGEIDLGARGDHHLERSGGVE